MTKKKKRIVSLDIYKRTCDAMTEDIKHATDPDGMELSRHQIADRMTKIMGGEITKAMIDNWSGKRHPGHHFPIIYLPAFVQATGQRRLFRLIMEKCVPTLALIREVSQITQRMSALKGKKEMLEKTIEAINE